MTNEQREKIIDRLCDMFLERQHKKRIGAFGEFARALQAMSDTTLMALILGSKEENE